jgi:phenylacetate-CoA ligase
VMTFAFKYARNLRKSQVAQVGPAHWELRIVPDTGYSKADEELLVHNVRTMVDPTVRLTIVLCDDLPDTAAGKFRWIVNEWQDGTRS